MRRIVTIASLLCMALWMAGCASSSRVTYGDPEQVETVTTEFGSTDLQMIADKMVNSLLSIPALTSGQRPVLYVHRVKNRTDEHLDTKSVTDKIRTALLNSGQVRFTAIDEVNDELIRQLEYQANSGYVDPRTSSSIGRQVGADYFLFGEITSIRKSAGRVEDVYFKFTLNLVDIESGLIEWADEKEIRKQAKRPLMGR
ncbi:MAG: penicillin-binding protein activator LpoB [Desulfomonilia bacterium]|jgi:uncharacterized protein (TIGR02722 family)